ncbi:MAG: pyrroline-5-carboxylate reductase [Clostridia bacterium]|nr:pyrroline-5-carboxylate reductase [Clostridia bacterium]
MTDKRNPVGFIGAGVMGSILAGVVSEAGFPLLISDRDRQKADDLAGRYGGRTAENSEVAAECRYIFLAVKPQVLDEVLREISGVLTERQDRFTVVSMAAGVSTRHIASLLGEQTPIIRIMPNTPAGVREGMILFCLSNATDADVGGFREIMSAAGRLDRIPEGLIDAGSALSGCGPAFVYMFIEALADGAVCCGLPRDRALLYAAQTVRGAATTVLETSEHPGKLKDDVCSPGGTTIDGVHALENGAFRSSVMNAVVSSYEKTLSLRGEKK